MVVGVIADEHVRSYKGEPIRNLAQRQADVAFLPCVDAVVCHSHVMDFASIEEYKVNIRAVGPEYGEHEGQKECLAELRNRGIEIVVLPRTPGISTTIMKERGEK